MQRAMSVAVRSIGGQRGLAVHLTSAGAARHPRHVNFGDAGPVLPGQSNIRTNDQSRARGSGKALRIHSRSG